MKVYYSNNFKESFLKRLKYLSVIIGSLTVMSSHTALNFKAPLSECYGHSARYVASETHRLADNSLRTNPAFKISVCGPGFTSGLHQLLRLFHHIMDHFYPASCCLWFHTGASHWSFWLVLFCYYVVGLLTCKKNDAMPPLPPLIQKYKQ